MMIKKIVKYLSLFVITLVTSINVIKATDMVYDSYKVGDKITYNNMDFYVIADSDSNQDYVTLLKAEPLSVDEVNKYGNGHVNRYTAESYETEGTATNQNGYGGMAYYTSPTCGFSKGGNSSVETGCTTDYAKSEVKYVVDAWALDKFQASDLKEDTTGYSVRLITYDELTNNLGYTLLEENTTAHVPTQGETPNWVYNSNYSYWTMSSPEDSMTSIFVVSNIGNLNYSNRNIHTNGVSNVVRPVVTLKKQEHEYKNLCAKNFKIGDIIKYNDILFYVIKDSNDENNAVTAIKAEPLTVDEINTYGTGHVNMYSTYNTSASHYQTAYVLNDYGGMAYYSSTTCGYPTSGSSTSVTTGCTTDYAQSEVKYVVDAWAKDKFQTSDLKEDETGYSARLITYYELFNNLGYNAASEGLSWLELNPEYTPSWVYNSNYWYWTMSPYEDSALYVWLVGSGGGLYHSSLVYDDFIGSVRPVVTFAKQNCDSTNDNLTTKVSVPDTLLSMPILGVIIGIFILIVSLIIIYVILKNKHKNIKS